MFGDMSADLSAQFDILRSVRDCGPRLQVASIGGEPGLLDYSHDPVLVLASLGVALMAGFTGLSLTHGASSLDIPARKRNVSIASVALGVGIWSMHFVAMLGVELPVPFYYDGLTTLISALVAVLITGGALVLLHFFERTPLRIVLAGSIVGLGIPAMHYLGMSGIELCRPIYSWSGLVLSVLASLGLSVLAIWLAYGRRARLNILLGTLGFGASVFAMHFIAMSGTGFVQIPDALDAGTRLSNDLLAFGVTIAIFALSGAFLLTGATFSHIQDTPLAAAGRDANVEDDPAMESVSDTPAQLDPVKIPYQRDALTGFAQPDTVLAIRAEGHYTYLYTTDEKLFCPWSITQAEERLRSHPFLRTHRSYLVNLTKVSHFERKKDTGVCHFDGSALSVAPVSRSKLAATREALGLE